MVVYYRQGGGSGNPGERGGVVIFEGTCILETILHRNFQKNSPGEYPQTPPPVCLTLYVMSFWYPPLLLKRWEDNDGGGVEIFPASQKEGIIFFFSENSRSHRDGSLRMC